MSWPSRHFLFYTKGDFPENIMQMVRTGCFLIFCTSLRLASFSKTKSVMSWTGLNEAGIIHEWVQLLLGDANVFLNLYCIRLRVFLSLGYRAVSFHKGFRKRLFHCSAQRQLISEFSFKQKPPHTSKFWIVEFTSPFLILLYDTAINILISVPSTLTLHS